MFRTERISLPSSSPGTQRSLLVHRFGPTGGRKAYLQASLHADELPGLLVLHHLLGLLKDATLLGEVVVVPYANPIGLSQNLGGHLWGRHELHSLDNFNRHYPELSREVGDAVEGRLGRDPAENVALIRREMLAALERRAPRSELDFLRTTLLRLAVDADIVLDLHCDFEATLHLYLGTPLWPQAADLAAELGSAATLTAEVSGGEPYDEAAGGPWWTLARRFPQVPIPPACLSATVELRGEADVSDAVAQKDAAGIFRFLQRRGLIAGDPGPLPPLPAEATPFDGVEMLRAPSAGLLVWHLPVGARTVPGQVVADLVDPMAEPGAPRTPIVATTAGAIYGRVRVKMVRPGQIVAKIAGAETVRKGYLLTD